MKRVYLCTALFTGALLFSPGLSAQSGSAANGAAEPQKDVAIPVRVRVVGTVRNAEGVSVPAATVRVVHVASGEAWVTWTDDDGKFSLPEMPAGRYRLEARQLGLGTATREAEFTGTASAGIDLTLHVSPPTAQPAANPAESSSKRTSSSAQATGQANSGTAADQAEPAKKTHHHKQATTQEAAATSGTAKPATKPGVDDAPAEQVKSHHHKDRTGEHQPSAPAADTAKSSAPHASQPGNEVATNSQRKPKAGLQQVEPTGQPTAVPDTATPDPGAPPDASPLGQASSSSALFVGGTVGQTSTVQGARSFDPSIQRQGTGPAGFNADDDVSAPKEKVSGKTKGHHHSHKAQPKPLPAGTTGIEGIEGLGLRQRLSHISSNRVRFSAYNRYANSVWDARPYGLEGAQSAKTSYQREQAGFHLGGPLHIPRIYDGRDRTFFFVGYELDRRSLPFSQFETVPSPAERQGDFTARGVQLFDPFSNLSGPRTPMGSVIPASRLDPIALGIVQLMPLPNLPGTVENFHRLGTVPQDNDKLNLRVLHSLSPRFSLSAAYNLVSARGQVVTAYPSFLIKSDIRDQNVTFNLTQNWTSHFLNESRVNFNRSRILVTNGFAFVNDISGKLGIGGVSHAPIDFGVPIIEFDNFDGVDDANPLLNRNQTLRIGDNVAYILAKHTLRAGAEVRRRQLNSFEEPSPRGFFSFSGLMTSQLKANGRPVQGTGFDFADFLLGLPESSFVQFGSPTNYFRNWWYLAYFQDDWRIHPRFSVNFGVRYELVRPPVEKFDHLVNLDLNRDMTAVARVLPGQVGPFSGSLPRSLLRPDTSDWAPRIGMAWRPLKRGLVVRAGYGMFYNTSIYDVVSDALANQPPFAQSRTVLTSSTQLLTLKNGFPPVAPNFIPNTVAVDPNYRIGYAQIWNLSAETPIAPNLLMEITYTGTQGTHLDLMRTPNRAQPGNPFHTENNRRIPNAPDFTYDTFGASSTYHALDVRVQRRMSHGLRILGLYTFSKSIDNAAWTGTGFSRRRTSVQDDLHPELDRGLSPFDVRHQFRVSYTYELPFGERKRWLRSGRLSALLANWQMSGNTVYSSGQHFTAVVRGAAANNGTGALFAARADQTANPNLPADQRTTSHFFNTAAFTVPTGVFGTAGRGTITGPSTFTVNFALNRRLRFGKDDRYRIDLRWEVQNLTNSSSFVGLHTPVDTPDFGRVVGASPMRTMDFLVRVHF